MKYFQDPTVPDREKRKKVYFWEDKQKHLNFILRLQVDGLKQGQFLRAIVDGYMNDDADLLAYMEKYKEKWTVQGINKRGTVKRLRKQAALEKEKFSLGETEIESIFDLIEKETGL